MQIPQFDRYDREPIAESTLTLLCDLAVGDTNRPLRHIEADWPSVFEAVCHNGLLGLTYTYLAANPTTTYPPTSFREAITQTFRLSVLRMAMIYKSVVWIFDKLNNAKIDYLVVKGPAVAHTIYPNASARIFNDLDIIVHESDWSIIHHFLVEQGFEQEESLPTAPPKIVPQAVAYETKYWNEKLGLKIEVHYDDILNAGLASRDIDGFWKRAISVDIKGVSIKTLSLEDQLIHLCAHIHYHGYTRLSWFADIALLLRLHGDKLDWNQFIKTVEIEEAQISTYYSLHFLDVLLGIRASDWVMAAVKPDRFRCWLHDRYMPQDRILSFQPTTRPDFSFYFIPLYKRMLPDLLVMGRRREKLRYMMRLLVPPKLWLQYYYRFKDRRWLGLHYLIHPFRLMGVYLRETLLVILYRKYVG